MVWPSGPVAVLPGLVEEALLGPDDSGILEQLAELAVAAD